MSISARLSAAVLSSLCLSSILHAEIDFNRDVRPILSDRCFACHGPDEHDRKADLRLDTYEGATTENDGVVAIVPGDLDASEFWYRITTDDEDDIMPPRKMHKDLTDPEIAILQEWIESGATYEQHWAYAPVARPEIPGDNHPIDHLVGAGLADQGVQPVAEADRRTLARRLSLDLRGLAPSPEEVDAFVADTTPETYTRYVDSLLSSTAYGERMAVYWLDLARYADTIGYHSDNMQEVSAYRDYVIHSFNKNLPYDQFVTEQLAGDLLPNATRQQKVASAYNRLLQSTEEGGAQPREYEKIHAADRVRNTSVMFLGSTIGCAQCHDHKYDPFTARDFYSFAAFFDDIKEKPIGKRQPNLKLPTVAQQEQLDALQEKLNTQTIVAALERDPALREKIATDQAAWETSQSTGDSLVTLIPNNVSTSGSKHEVAEDGTVKLLPGENPAKENLTIKSPSVQGSYGGLVLHALEDPSFPRGGLTPAGNGNFVLTRVQVFHKGKEIKLVRAEADFEQKDWPVAHAINGNGAQGWAVSGHEKSAPHSALFAFENPIDAADGDEIQVRLQHNSAHPHHVIGKFQIALTTDADPLFARIVGPTAEIAALLKKAAPVDGAEPSDSMRSPEEQKQLADYYLSSAAALDDLRAQRSSWEKEHRALDGSLRKILVSESLMGGNMRTTTILNRGDWMDEAGEVVLPAVPAFLAIGEAVELGAGAEAAEAAAAAEPERATRLDLAEWIVSPENPLTARAFVNRLWMLLMGRGIAADVTDLGGQGTMPSHPELLDYLAAEFVESGWDIQHLIRTIVGSDTYKRSSVAPADLLASDPDNVWLARQGRWRVDAEFVRDIALQHANLLVDKQGGDSVKPLQPAGYWAQLNFPKRTWEPSPDTADRYRRGLYTFWCRSFLHPSLVAFDAPTREECSAERTRSNIPQQALVLLNDPSFVEAAQALAKRAMTEGGDTDASRLHWLWEQCLSRNPEPAEQQLIATLLENQRQKPSELASDEEATWTAVTRALLNTYETTARF